MVQVVNLKKEPCDFYCGRITSYKKFDKNFGKDLSILGNVFGVKWKRLTPEESLPLYREYLESKVRDGDVSFLKAFEEIHLLDKEKNMVSLGCFCKPKKCHVDHIVDVYYQLYPEVIDPLFS